MARPADFLPESLPAMKVLLVEKDRAQAMTTLDSEREDKPLLSVFLIGGKIAWWARDATNRPGIHIIKAAGRGHKLREHRPSGSDAASIGAWPENSIFGTQLGPNRNARPIAPKRPSS